MLECQNNQEIDLNVFWGLLFFFFFFEESLVLEFQKAQLGTKCHLLLATETAKPG